MAIHRKCEGNKRDNEWKTWELQMKRVAKRRSWSAHAIIPSEYEVYM